MFTWINILIQSIELDILELIWPIQFIGKLKFKYYGSNEWGRCFEIHIIAKSSTSNNESSAAAIIGGSSRRRVHRSFIRVCSKYLDFQLSKIRRIKEKIRRRGCILKWLGKQFKEGGGISCETERTHVIAWF